MTQRPSAPRSARAGRRRAPGVGPPHPEAASTGRAHATGELFCGAGGLSRGFHAQGFSPRFANDIWDLAVHNFMMNFDATYERTNGDRSGDVLGVPGSIEELDPAQLMAR